MDEKPGIARGWLQLLAFLGIPLLLSGIIWAIIAFVLHWMTHDWTKTIIGCVLIALLLLTCIIYLILFEQQPQPATTEITEINPEEN